VRRDFLVFDLWGDLAHFRRYDTTSSPLSWPFPPRPTVFGTVAAILGLGKDDYLGVFQDEGVEAAVSILKRPRSLRISYNHVDTKAARDFGRMKKSGGRTQIRREVLADVRYRIFFRHPDQKLQEDLTTLVRAHQSIYTVSLGLASMLADFAFVASATAAPCSLEEETEIISVVPYDLVRPIPTTGSAPLLLTGMPRQMTPERIVTVYQDVIYDARRPTLLVRAHQDGLTAPDVAYNFGELGIVTPL
jgi:CRISPR-associated protein Cas5h